MAQAALRFTLRERAVSCAVVGIKDPEAADENLAASENLLSSEELRQIRNLQANGFGLRMQR